jgi:TP901 family phage tail tape measure protein
MALDDNRISFGVDVSTGQSEESINKVIDRIDGLKDKINELKKLRTENKQDADIFANYTKSIRDTERELSKLQSTYNSWIQKATNIDTKPIGDVKKQTQEFISLLKQWDGQSATFQKQVMSHFMIPNSAVDQLKLYKNIMGELQGLQGKGVINSLNAVKALSHLTTMAKTAQLAVDQLKATLKGTSVDALLGWNGKGNFVNEVPGYWDNNSLIKRQKKVKDAYDELLGRFGSNTEYPKVQIALRQLESEYQRLTKEIKEANNALKGATSDTSGIDKQAKATGKLAEEEEKLSRIRQQLNSWGGKGSFSSSISGFENLDSYSRQIQALRRAYEELNAVKGKNGIDNAKVEAAIDSVKSKYDELVAKKNQVDAELKKGTEDVAKASKKAADEESANIKKTIDEYTRLKLRMAEIQEQIKNNYVANFKTSPALYNTNFARLSAEYKEVADAVNQADRNMARFATKADFAGRAMDRLYQRSAWFFSAIGANAIIALPNAWYDAQTKIENSMAQFSQVMATNSHSVNAFKTALFDMDFGKLQQGLSTTSVQSKEFIKDLDYMENSLINLAIKYGEASDDVIKSATLWGRKYKDNQTVLTMTNAAMKLAVADSFSIVEANKNLESSLVQWGFQIKDNNDAMIVSNKIIDSWTALAHKMAVSAQDLSAANQRAAQSMRAVGLSFDEGQALIATMLANTQQAGGEIGNAVKSIMGSIHSKKAIEDLEAMGVAVYKFGENGKKEFREVGKVLVDLMLKTQNSKENLEKLLKDVSGGKIAICPSLK